MGIIINILIPKIITKTEYELTKQDFMFDETIVKHKDNVFIFRENSKRNVWYLQDLSLTMAKQGSSILYIIVEKTNSNKIGVIVGTTFDLSNTSFNFRFSEDIANIINVKNKLNNIINLSNKIEKNCEIRIYNINLDEENIELIFNDENKEKNRFIFLKKPDLIKILFKLPFKHISTGVYLKILLPFIIGFTVFKLAISTFEFYYQEPTEQLLLEETQVKTDNDAVKMDLEANMILHKSAIMKKAGVEKNKIFHNDNDIFYKN